MEQSITVGNFLYALITTDPYDHIELWSPEAENIFGWSAQEIEGQKLSETVFSQSVQQLYASVQATKKASGANNDTDTSLERMAQCKDGRSIPVELFISDGFSTEGEFFIIYARDISDQKQEERRLQYALENQRILNLILNLSLKPISLSELLEQTLEALFGFKNISLIPRGGIFLIETDPAILVLYVHKGFKQEQVNSCGRLPFGRCHCGLAAATGKIQFASCIDERHSIQFADMGAHGHYCVPIHSGGRILGVIALYVAHGHATSDEEQEMFKSIANILAGIIERKRMEEQRAALIGRLNATINALLNEKLFSESIINSLNGGLVALDTKGMITLINPIADKILKNFSPAPMLEGKKLADIIGEEPVRAILEKGGGTGRQNNEITLKTLRAEERIIGFSTTARQDSSRAKVGYIVSFNDITEVKRTQTEMERMNHLITVAEIASAVAHEVRNPLAGIKTMSQAIEENLDDADDNKEYLHRIIRQVDRLNELLTNFFTYARPGKPKKRKISLVDIVGETKQLVTDKMAGRNIQFVENYEADLPPIFGDPNQIQQVFLNLMLNSIDAVSNNGVIEITARFISKKDRNDKERISFPDYNRDRDYIKVFFRDNGCGMTTEVIERAFKPFYSTKPHGAGLGLAIVHRILNENNAFIYLDSTESKGTTFILFFETL